MEILGVSRATAYGIIKTLNTELEAQGYLVKSGRVPVHYFHKRTHSEEPGEAAGTTKGGSKCATARSKRAG